MGRKQSLPEINGHVTSRDTEYYHMVINAGFLPDGKRNRISISTGLTLKGNQRKANSMLNETILSLKIAREKTGALNLRELHRLVKDDGCDSLNSDTLSYQPEQVNPASDENGPMFSDVIDEWLLYHSTRVSANTLEKYKYAAKHVKTYFDGVPVGDITSRMLARYFVKKKAGDPQQSIPPLAAKTLAEHKIILNLSLMYAKTILKVIASNPALEILPPRKEIKAPNFFTEDELNKVFALIQGNPIEPAVILAGNYGLRRQETLGLKWSAISFEDMTFTVRHTVTMVGSKEVASDRTKTTSSLRTLDLTESIKVYLHDLREHQKAMKAVFGDSYVDNDYVCKWPDGRPLKPNYVTREWGKFLAKNGFNHITFHDLRHSSASLLIHLGFSLKDIQEWLGHSDIKSTSRYTHLINENKRRIAQKVDKALSIPKMQNPIIAVDSISQKSKNVTSA